DRKYEGKEFRFDGIITRIERHYRRYRQREVTHSGMENYLQKVMVEHRCPDCRGTRLRLQRLLVTFDGQHVHQLRETDFSELRDLGNTVIVVEHDEDTIRAAEHVVEMGPGPGVHGGEVVVQGTIEDVLQHPSSLTGLYLSGKRQIEIPQDRRRAKGRVLKVKGA